MAGRNMAAITASLESSLQNCSLNHQSNSNSNSSSSSSSGSNIGRITAGLGRSSSSDSTDNHTIHDLPNSSDTTLELNSQISLPCYWEQCLDLKTGEVYYINWRTGMKAKEDPRTTSAAAADQYGGDFYSEDNSSDDSEGSSSESTPSSRDQNRHLHRHQQQQQQTNYQNDHVLVVAGCKSCLMYFMVPKQVGHCPKCCGQLLHFDRSDN